ncbi:hypothetical protein [Chryseobacterium indologenes]|uniref:Immunity protein 35 domain-containing protein n=1 Tax=Chryseobacterium indologenes TaxID=253 RepID=A0A0N1KSD8_CHRID|nr:hypothetical protein [Chryseobacterium indologenes]KPE50500.1 hypothetical protein AOB46_14000 [Chryseobacterium indologenes]
MLTDKEMLEIAERFIRRVVDKSIEPMLYDNIIKKPYGNIYSFNSKESILTGNFNKSLVGNAPFLVEKETGRVVGFGTSGSLEDYLEAYENGTFTSALDTYWYPDEDRFDYK